MNSAVRRELTPEEAESERKLKEFLADGQKRLDAEAAARDADREAKDKAFAEELAQAEHEREAKHAAGMMALAELSTGAGGHAVSFDPKNKAISIMLPFGHKVFISCERLQGLRVSAFFPSAKTDSSGARLAATDLVVGAVSEAVPYEANEARRVDDQEERENETLKTVLEALEEDPHALGSREKCVTCKLLSQVTKRQIGCLKPKVIATPTVADEAG